MSCVKTEENRVMAATKATMLMENMLRAFESFYLD